MVRSFGSIRGAESPNHARVLKVSYPEPLIREPPCPFQESMNAALLSCSPDAPDDARLGAVTFLIA